MVRISTVARRGWPFTMSEMVRASRSCGERGGGRERGREGAGGQDPGQALAVGARWRGCRRTDRPRRWRAGRPRRRPSPTARRPRSERSASVTRTGRGPDAEADDARVAHASLRVEGQRGGDAAQREVATPDRHLVQARSACAPATAEARSPSAARRAPSAVARAARKKSSAATVRRPRALPQREPGAQRHHHRRQLGGGIGMREAAAERAARADLRRGRRRAGPGRSGDSARESARSAPARAGGRGRRSAIRRRGRASTVASSATRLMSITWPGRARRKLSMRHQALAAGQDLGRVAVAGQEPERLLDRRGVVIAETGRLHRGEPRPLAAQSQGVSASRRR